MYDDDAIKLVRTIMNYSLQKIESYRIELNEMNYFPVADKDTGNNMVMTWNAGAEIINNYENVSLEFLLSEMSTNMMIHSCGNSGTILSCIFSGITDYFLENKDTCINVVFLYNSFYNGLDYAKEAIKCPAEGTMLTVFSDVLEYVSEKNTKVDILTFLECFCEELNRAVSLTEQNNHILKENSVVDSGALGLKIIFESIKEVIVFFFNKEQSESIIIKNENINSQIKQVNKMIPEKESGELFCTEIVLKISHGLPNDYFFFENELNRIGDSLIIHSKEMCMKIHIHTAFPCEVIELCKKYGELLSAKTEMIKSPCDNHTLTLFCDTNCDITPMEARKLGIKLIRMPYAISNTPYYPYRDNVKFDFDKYYDMLREGIIPTTNSISVNQYITYFEPEFEKGNDILYIHFSAKMSSTFDNMHKAIEELKRVYPTRKFHSIDTKGVTLKSYAIVTEICKMIKKRMSIDQIVNWSNEEVKKYRTLFFVDNLQFFMSSGRVKKLSAVVGDRIGVRPIITINDDGEMICVGRVVGREKAIKKITNYLLSEIHDERHAVPIRIIVGGTTSTDKIMFFVEKIRKQLLEDGEEVKFEIVRTNPTIAAHCGPDALGICFYCGM